MYAMVKRHITGKHGTVAYKLTVPGCCARRLAVPASMSGNPFLSGAYALGSGLRVSVASASSASPSSKDGCAAVLPNVSLDVLTKLDIRVGVVVKSESITVEVEVRRGNDVRKRNKRLLRLQVDVGPETRVIVTDVPSLDEESAPGKKLMVLVNVPPATVHGHPSHGMLLLGTNYDQTPMPASLKTVLPGPGRLPAGASYTFV